MKNIVGVFLLLIFESLTCGLFAQSSKWDGKTINTAWYDPNAKYEGDTVRLKSAAEFAGFNRLVSSGTSFKNCTVILDVDIDLDGNEWSSIGLSDDQRYETSFEGVFDGKNHKISGYKSDNGLFISLGNGGVISNLSIDGLIQHCPIPDGGESVGTIVSEMEGGSIVSSCTSNVALEIEGSGEYYQPSLRYGGIVGRACGIVRYCRVNSPIVIKGISSFSNSLDKVATISVGGIAGSSSSSCLHDNEFCDSINCQANRFVRNIGGITGSCAESEVRNCFFYGKIESGPKYAQDVHIGGICGFISKFWDSKSSVFEECLAVGEPSSILSDTEYSSSYKVYMGGICGYSMGDVSIKNCYFQNDMLSINEHVTVTELGTGSDHLFGVTQLNGFSKRHWLFSDINYPHLRGFPEEMICEIGNPPSGENWLVGDKCIPSVKIYPEDAYQSYEIFTPDTTMVDIQDNVVTFKKGGDVKLICSTINGIDALFQINVKCPIESMYFEEDSVVAYINKTYKLNLVKNPTDAYEIITWSSSNPNVISVDDKGVITTLKRGSAEITATSSSGLSCLCKVNVIFPNSYPIMIGCSEYRVLSDKDMTLSFTKYSGEATDIVIPESVLIGNDISEEPVNFTVISIGGTDQPVFQNASTVTSVDLPLTLTYISSCAFSECSSLNSIIIPENVISIGYESFLKCTSLRKVKIPDTVTTIETSAFYGCNQLEFLDLGESVAMIGAVAFYDCGLRAIYCRAATPPSISIGYNPTFSKNSARLFVPENSFSDYLNSYWEKPFFESISPTDFIDRVEIEESEITMLPNKDYNLKWKITPTIIGKEWTFISSNEAIASVSNQGYIHSHNCGESIITLKLIDSDLSSSCIIKVSVPVESISINPSQAYIVKGQKQQLSAVILPEDASDNNLVWASSSEDIAVVDDNGMVSAIGVGECVITAKSIDGSDVSASCNITVLPILVNSISIDKSEWSGMVGETIQLMATVLPEEATDKLVIWTSSNDAVATVDTEGYVTAISVGEAVIAATAADGSGMSATCHVTVLPVLVETIILSPDNWNGEEGMTFQIDASVLPDNATDKKLRWVSSDKAVAIVDEDGFVAILKAGTCVITATATDGSGRYAECIITSSAGIDEIFTDGETSWNVYDINGTLLKKNCDKDDIKLLSSGIYILQSGGRIIKIIIR